MGRRRTQEIYLPVDVDILAHDKFVRAGDDGTLLWLAAACWCRKFLKDGLISSEVVGELRAKWTTTRRNTAVRRLVDVGLWHEVPGGFQIHDWTDWNPTAERIEARREADRRRKADGNSEDSERNPDGIQTESDRKDGGSRADSKRPFATEDRGRGTSVKQQQAKPLPTTPNGKVPAADEADPECYEAWLIEARRRNQLRPRTIGNPKGWARTLALKGKWPDEPEPEPPDQTPEYMR